MNALLHALIRTLDLIDDRVFLHGCLADSIATHVRGPHTQRSDHLFWWWNANVCGRIVNSPWWGTQAEQ